MSYRYYNPTLVISAHILTPYNVCRELEGELEDHIQAGGLMDIPNLIYCQIPATSYAIRQPTKD